MKEWTHFGKYYRIDAEGEVQSSFSGAWKSLKQKKSKSDKSGGWYLTVSINGTHKRLHLLMWEVFKGPRRKGYVINHIDGDRSNCRINNLEEVTQKENIANLIARGNFKLFGKAYEGKTIRDNGICEDLEVRSHVVCGGSGSGPSREICHGQEV